LKVGADRNRETRAGLHVDDFLSFTEPPPDLTAPLRAVPDFLDSPVCYGLRRPTGRQRAMAEPKAVAGRQQADLGAIRRNIVRLSAKRLGLKAHHQYSANASSAKQYNHCSPGSADAMT
jgi:hypothetical protein